MTRDEIAQRFETFFEWDTDDRSIVTSTSAKLFAEHIAGLAVAAEREACAKICESLATDRGMFHPDDEELKIGVLAGAGMCGVTIRARGEK